MDAETNKPVLVTGASGFIGHAVLNLLQREGYSVLALDQTPSVSTAASFKAGRGILADIAGTEKLQEIFQAGEIAGVVHLAAILPTAAQREPERATRVNIFGSLNLLDMARQSGVRRFVFGSSLSAYGSHPPDEVVSEDSRSAPEDLYGASKLYVEQLGAAYRERLGLEFVSLRIGRVVGEGARSATSAWRSQIFEFLNANDASEITVPYVDSERLLLVHVDDVARALAALLKATKLAHTVYNAPCESVVVGDLKREIEGLNSNIKVRVGEASSTGNPRLVDDSRFRREFGFEMTPIMARLRAYRFGIIGHESWSS